MPLGSLADLRERGFQGFLKLSELIDFNLDSVPSVPGVYAVIRNMDSLPAFLLESVGGHFKGKDPSVSRGELRDNWVENTVLLYVGKAGGTSSSATLRSRLRQLQQFGSGRAVGHWGGRFLWQLAEHRDLVVCWLPILDMEPEVLERTLLAEFSAAYDGKLPFANLRR